MHVYDFEIKIYEFRILLTWKAYQAQALDVALTKARPGSGML